MPGRLQALAPLASPTLYIARLVRERGGHLHTVEESADWADTLMEQVGREGLASTAGGSELGHDRPQDRLLAVDGPVAERAAQVRYPALPYLHRSFGFGVWISHLRRRRSTKRCRQRDRVGRCDREQRWSP
jgi:hypothetical protein